MAPSLPKPKSSENTFSAASNLRCCFLVPPSTHKTRPPVALTERPHSSVNVHLFSISLCLQLRCGFSIQLFLKKSSSRAKALAPRAFWSMREADCKDTSEICITLSCRQARIFSSPYCQSSQDSLLCPVWLELLIVSFCYGYFFFFF